MHIQERNLVCTFIMSRRTKKLLGPIPSLEQEVIHFDVNVIFVKFMPILKLYIIINTTVFKFSVILMPWRSKVVQSFCTSYTWWPLWPQIWRFEHTPKLTKFGTYITSGENCDTALSLGAVVICGHCSAPYYSAPPSACALMNEIV